MRGDRLSMSGHGFRSRPATRAQRLAKLGFEDYNAYLASALWQRARERHLAWVERCNRKAVCLSCHTKNALDFHHLTYERLGEELGSDLVLLCRDCHEEFHRWWRDGGYAGSLQQATEVFIATTQIRRRERRICRCDCGEAWHYKGRARSLKKAKLPRMRAVA